MMLVLANIFLFSSFKACLIYVHISMDPCLHKIMSLYYNDTYNDTETTDIYEFFKIYIFSVSLNALDCEH